MHDISKETKLYLSYVELVSSRVDYYYTHRELHGSAAKGETSAESDHLLYELKRDYPTVFFEPTFPVWEHHTPFSIPLIDESV